MEKPICTMIREAEVTFYRETEETENLVSSLPRKQNQMRQHRVFFTSPGSTFVKGEDDFLSHVPPDDQTAEVGVATGFMKGHSGKVRMSQWSLPSAGVCQSFRVFLESTQADFSSWKPCRFCVLS